jgi:hypothetical protein
VSLPGTGIEPLVPQNLTFIIYPNLVATVRLPVLNVQKDIGLMVYHKLISLRYSSLYVNPKKRNENGMISTTLTISQ